MQNLLEQFLAYMDRHGCTPKNACDIKPDDARRYYAIKGDVGGRKSGAYCLKIDGDWGVGWFINYRVGDVIKWTASTRDDNRTDAERKAFRKKIEEERKIKEDQERVAADEAAKMAEEIFDLANKTGQHPYAERKNLSGLHGAKIYEEKIIIPAGDARGVRTIQSIDVAGNKLFLKGGNKKGCFFKIGFGDIEPEKIIICEGWATGCSLFECTGVPVVVAFDAGNLKPVFDNIKKEYKNSEFIIAADNDAWTLKPKFKPETVDPQKLSANDRAWDEWREKGFLVNTGVEKARAVSDKCKIAIPKFMDVSTRPTDFNDLFVLEGCEAVKKIIESANGIKENSIPDEIPPPDEEEAKAIVSLYASKEDERKLPADWKSRLHVNDKGVLIGASLHNTMLFIENEEILSKIFCYDEFSCEKIVYQCPPWANPKNFRPRPVNDEDVTCLAAYLERFGLKCGIKNVSKALSASVKKNPKNPAQEYFLGLKWDGVKRLDYWLRDYCGCVYEEKKYISAIGRKWLCAAVKRVLSPGTKFDHMLILEGEQGTGKSSILKELATIHGTPYFDDTIDVPSLGSKDSVMKFQGVLIIEIAELAGIQKRDANELKKQITVCHDRIVLKYENEPTTYPRKFVLAGTINPMGYGYLSDPTGNRRFWPATTSKMDIVGISKVKEQLWAEAYEAVCNGEKLYLDVELAKLAARIVSDRSAEHPWASELEDLSRGMSSVSNSEIWDTLGIHDRSKRTQYALNEISKIMTRLGFEYKQVRTAAGRVYRWSKKDKDEELC